MVLPSSLGLDGISCWALGLWGGNHSPGGEDSLVWGKLSLEASQLWDLLLLLLLPPLLERDLEHELLRRSEPERDPKSRRFLAGDSEEPEWGLLARDRGGELPGERERDREKLDAEEEEERELLGSAR